jgi:hypothetical protein
VGRRGGGGATSIMDSWWAVSDGWVVRGQRGIDEETNHKEQVETKGEAARSHSHKKKEGDRSHGQLNGTVRG